MSAEEELVIGEGVVLDASAATVALRAAGGLLDVVILLFVYFMSLWALGVGGIFNIDSAAFAAVALSHLVLTLIGIPIAVETLTRGRSVGKLAAGIRIVRDDGGPITFRHAFARGLIGIIELWAFAASLAIFTSLFAKRSKRIGDMVAGTYALRVRGMKNYAAPIAAAPTLQEWARHVDIRRLPDGLALRARQFASRANSLSSPSRNHFAREFYAELMPYVSPPPPHDSHPEAVVMTVLATRRDREYHLLMEQQQHADRDAGRVRRLPLGIPDVEN